MSTPVPEPCPNCGRRTRPRELLAEKQVGPFYARRWTNWAYRCGDKTCGWVWANDAQREHNRKAYTRATGGG